MVALDVANAIVEGTFRAGVELKAKPLTVAVIDAGGCLTAFARQDGSSVIRPQIAEGKAFAALSMQMSSRQMGEVAAQRPAFMQALMAAANANGKPLVPVPGGVLLFTPAGELVGAVGCSGDTSDVDEQCILRAIAATGYKTAKAKL